MTIFSFWALHLGSTIWHSVQIQSHLRCNTQNMQSNEFKDIVPLEVAYQQAKDSLTSSKEETYRLKCTEVIWWSCLLYHQVNVNYCQNLYTQQHFTYPCSTFCEFAKLTRLIRASCPQEVSSAPATVVLVSTLGVLRSTSAPAPTYRNRLFRLGLWPVSWSRLDCVMITRHWGNAL